MTEPLISIVMPAYNAENTIKDAIQSVINQTYRNWELIIVDDCSKDNTCDVIKTYLIPNGKIRLLQNQHNSGVSITRNCGVSATNGNWIAFLDSDDMWMPDKLEKQLNIIRQNRNADLVYTGSSFIDTAGNPSGYILHVPKNISYTKLLKQNLISCSSTLIRKELILKYPMQYDDMHEDYAVWLQILKNGGHAYGVDEPLLIYRLSNQSKSSNKRKAAGMTFKVYRFVGLSYIQAFYYFCWYAMKNIKKYYDIRSALKTRGE